jgi:hypothetical protein
MVGTELAVTTKEAASLTTVPLAFVTTHRNWSPLIEVNELATVKVLVPEPE